jgi:hypothetical protein
MLSARRTLLALALAFACLPTATTAAGPSPLVPNFTPLRLAKPEPCGMEKKGDSNEALIYALSGWEGPDYVRYPGACERLHFAYGPILVKPGQNDVLVEPITIQKPMRDGYIVGFKPNLKLPDGTVPPVEQVHLHHGTWLSAPNYGNGPFFASGEEKTIAPFPKGYGMPIKASDIWLLLYMVHSAVPNPMLAYITYDVDFIPKAEGDKLGIKPAYPIWLDVRPSAYPVFNVQRQFGNKSGTCVWPKQRCSLFDPFGSKIVGQGKPGNGLGTDMHFPKRGGTIGAMRNFKGGTLIGIGGHLHPGGHQNFVDLVRNGKSKRIYTGEAVYWDHKDPSKGGGTPDSWDFSMTVTALPFWGIHVDPGDTLRSNASYFTKYGSTYENMGIEIALFAPDTPDGKPTAKGINPFEVKSDHSRLCKTWGLMATPRPTLCDHGFVTHGHYAENGNHKPKGGTLNARLGGPTNDVGIANFSYIPGDLSNLSTTGIPTVKLGTNLNFQNWEGGLIYHSITACEYPCKGPTTASFPFWNGRASSGRAVDFDSGQLAIGAPYIGPAKQRLDWSLPVTPAAGYRPGEVVTYFCRIHPFMRGAFEVTQ